ncbi:ABC transporter ATP-binding protein [Lacibacter sp. H375]|uniref:ABC transporter ATP-binding protein n=1 Tax=Lacibacter sp. H375 TaxID=3133424 RepID=UPI0030C5F3E1
MAFLEVNALYKKEGDTDAVNGISFTQTAFQKIGIAGETGSGKTTLLKMIAGLAQPDAGEVYFNDEKVLGPWEQLIPGHKGIGYLSQHFELRNNYWVGDFLEMANKLTPEQAMQIYTVCQVEHLLRRRTHQLSGGEKQRIALARLLTGSPKLLILDEPFSNLDFLHKQTMKEVIHDLGDELGISCIMVSHEPADLLSWADALLLMKDGKIIQQGNPQQVYLQPVNEYAAGLLGDYSLVDTSVLHISNASTQQKLFLRPHQLQVSKNGIGSFSGTVEAVHYRGAYQLLQISLQQQQFFILSTDRLPQRGEVLSFNINLQDRWLI